jgi:GH43 family beta-xylosidase
MMDFRSVGRTAFLSPVTWQNGWPYFGLPGNLGRSTPDGRIDVFVYHARNYREIPGEALSNPDRATCAQAITWKPDDTPDFGVPVADGRYRIAQSSKAPNPTP